MGKLSPDEVRDFRKTILENYRLSGRSFPWRETRNPYEILVSEMMLQQTQTDRVVSKYLDWLSVFPSAEALAIAPFSSVLEKWIGLGYNRRARFLHESCKSIVTDHAGIFPQDSESLDALPGIGPYTACAVSTFAFGTPNVFIETNIRSVFLFFFFSSEKNVPDSRILELVEETLDRDNPRDWYYALMDYGAILKKTVQNPNRKSSHYAKQSKFDGSVRQARGAIIRYIGKKGNAELESIAAEEHIPYERLTKAAASLVEDKLVVENNGFYRIQE